MLYGNHCCIIIENFPQKFSPCAKLFIVTNMNEVRIYTSVNRISQKPRKFCHINSLMYRSQSLFELHSITMNQQSRFSPGLFYPRLAADGSRRFSLLLLAPSSKTKRKNSELGIPNIPLPPRVRTSLRVKALFSDQRQPHCLLRITLLHYPLTHSSLNIIKPQKNVEIQTKSFADLSNR